MLLLSDANNNISAHKWGINFYFYFFILEMLYSSFCFLNRLHLFVYVVYTPFDVVKVFLKLDYFIFCTSINFDMTDIACEIIQIRTETVIKPLTGRIRANS